MFNFGDHLQELRSLIIGLVLLLATTVIGLVWISIGLCHSLSIYLGSTWGPIVLGFIFFIPIFIFAFVKAFGRNTKHSQQQADLNGYADASASHVAKVVESLSGHSPFFVASVAIIMGVIVTRFPALLSVFMQVLSAYSADYKARSMKNTTE